MTQELYFVVLEVSYMLKYKRYRFPISIISHVVWCYYRFSMSLRDVEELMLARGIKISYETIRTWSIKYGNLYSAEIKKRKPAKGDKWHIDEMCIKMNGQRFWLFRAVDQFGYELDIMLQPRRNKKAVIRFFSKLLKDCQYIPRVIVTDRLRSYYAPCKGMFPKTNYRKHKGLNNRVENAHQPTRKREKQMVRFKSAASAQQFIAAHGQVRNLFMVGRYNSSASSRKIRIAESLGIWDSIAHSCQQAA